MTFTPGIPQTGQSLGQSRDLIRDNFTNYNNVVSVDHVVPNAANQGQHKQITLNTFGAFPYTAVGTNSFIGAYNASAAGTQLVYQPSVATKFVPCTPRSMARISNTGGTTFALQNGPYGAGTNFNVVDPGVSGVNSFIYTFASPLASTDYFVFTSCEGHANTINIDTKTVNGFRVLGANVPSPAAILIMVY